MKIESRNFFWFVFGALLVLLFAAPRNSLATQYPFAFGGTHGPHYFPDSYQVFVGDTITWQGGGPGEDFTKYDLRSTTIPAGADSIGPVFTGNTYTYIIRIAGEYDFESKTWAALGMTGKIIAAPIHNGLSNEGREFYLGMIYPNYNIARKNPYLHTYAMINSYYANVITVSYFDPSGQENPPRTFRTNGKSALKVPLDTIAMRIDITSDEPQYTSCHIVAKYPITVEYLSMGECSGGSYLALPVDGLGKNYVTACYNDDPGDGALLNPTPSAGAFMIIGTVDGTTVHISPSTTTDAGAHPGAIHGTGSGGSPSYGITLNRGAVYFARSKGDNSDNDMSGSLISASAPVVVLSGHENALIGGVDGLTFESRDFMVEQMVPVELWDSTGYISLPFVSPNGSTQSEGYGDKYRAFVFDNATIPVTFRYGNTSDPQYASRYHFASPGGSEKSIGSTPMEISSPKKISVMEYDERSQANSKPWPAPSMMTIAPKSHWKKYFAFNALDNSDRVNIIDMPFINVLSDQIDQIKVATGDNNGRLATPFVPIGTLTGSTFPKSDFSGDDPNLEGRQFRIPVPMGGPSVPYFFESPNPFMVYFYEMRIVTNIPTEYAAPAGMLLNTGENPQFVTTIDNTTKCGTWHICVQDTSTNSPGIKAVTLIDDPEGFFVKPGAQLRNASFDQSMPEYSSATGELHPNLILPTDKYCFDVNVTAPLDTALAPIAIFDNKGNASYFILQYNPPSLKLNLNPLLPARADSVVFPVQKTTVGQKVCSSFILINTAAIGGAPITIVSENFRNSKEKLFSVENAPAFPHTIMPQDTMRFEICYTPADTLRHRDSLIVQTNCIGFPISLDAHARTGLIYAEDKDFGFANVDGSSCRDIEVRNIGSAPLKIDSLILSDPVDFSITPQTRGSLPITIAAGGATQLSVCFNPKQEAPFSEQLTIVTDLTGEFANQIKSYSYLTGTAVVHDAVPLTNINASAPLEINPNPASGNYITVRFAPVASKAILRIADVLGRVLIQKEILGSAFISDLFIQELKAGTYYVLLTSDSGVLSQKLEVVR